MKQAWNLAKPVQDAIFHKVQKGDSGADTLEFSIF